jgi:hypothetical protein
MQATVRTETLEPPQHRRTGKTLPARLTNDPFIQRDAVVFVAFTNKDS